MLNNKSKVIAKNIACSPYKLRPIVDVIRNKSVVYALSWLGNIYKNRRVVPIKKAIESAVSNILYHNKLDPKVRTGSAVADMIITEIKIDQGGMRKYFIPGAQGKATIQRKRYAHISVIVEKSNKTSFLNKKNKIDEQVEVGNGTKG